MSMRIDGTRNWFWRKVLAFVGMLGSILYILYSLFAGKVDPIMEGPVVVVILFGLVSVAKQTEEILRSLSKTT